MSDISNTNKHIERVEEARYGLPRIMQPPPTETDSAGRWIFKKSLFATSFGPRKEQFNFLPCRGDGVCAETLDVSVCHPQILPPASHLVFQLHPLLRLGRVGAFQQPQLRIVEALGHHFRNPCHELIAQFVILFALLP